MLRHPSLEPRCSRAAAATARGARALAAAALAVALGDAAAARGQSLEELRDELRSSLRGSHFAASFSGLVLVSDELELSSARVTVDDGLHTRLSSIGLPFQTVLNPWGEDRPGLHLEGALGYALASQAVDDLFGGAAPGLEAAVDADWRTIGAIVGLGPSLRIGGGLVLAAVAQAGASRVTSEAGYGGPGAPLAAAVLDGIGLNWAGWVATAGGALRAGWARPLGDRLRVRALGRYDVRWSWTADVSDPAQEFTSRLQLVTVRADLIGPTGLRPSGVPLAWRATAGYRRFLEGDLLGVRDVVQLTSALEAEVRGRLPLVGTLGVEGGWILGGAVSGWTLGAVGAL